jgi:hypothetical protein
MLRGNRELISVANTLSSEIVDRHGFVSVDRLLERFNAQCIFRPLLVTAAISKHPDEAFTWAVLVDNESLHQAGGPDVFGSPWENRVRFSIAHELAHTIAFEESIAGLTLDWIPPKGRDLEELLKKIEYQTNLVTPNLLIPQETLFTIGMQLNPNELSVLCKNLGVSKRTLVYRFITEAFSDVEHQFRESVRNRAIGVLNRGKILRSPLFMLFEDNLVPFVFKKVVDDNLSVDLLEFIESNLVEKYSEGWIIEAIAGTSLNPEIGRFRLKVHIEDENASDDRLFVMEKIE